jgi:hypothetical protein
MCVRFVVTRYDAGLTTGGLILLTALSIYVLWAGSVGLATLSRFHESFISRLFCQFSNGLLCVKIREVCLEPFSVVPVLKGRSTCIRWKLVLPIVSIRIAHIRILHNTEAQPLKVMTSLHMRLANGQV